MRRLARLAWAVRSAAVAVAVGLWSALWITLGLLVRLLTGGPRATLWMARHCWAPFLVWLSGASVEVRGACTGGLLSRRLEGALVVMNHQSLFDIVIATRYLPAPVRFVAKRELRRVPFLGWHMAAVGMVFIERRASAGALERLGGAAEILAEGGTLVGFPEGTRSRDGRVAPFKTGVFLPALEAEAPVVPAAISGTGRILPPDGFRPRPGPVRLAVGPPIETRGLGVAGRKRLAAEARERVVELLASIDGG